MPAAAPVKESEKASGQKPVAVFRSRGVSAAVFANRSDSGIFHKVTLERTYKDGDEWKHTGGFSRDDLPHVQRVIDQAWGFILETEASRGKEEAAE